MEQLPSELWDHVLSYLSLPPDVVNALLVCQDFRALIQSNPPLVEVLTLPRFDEIDSRQVVLDEDGRRACCTSSTTRFPSYQFNTAFVRTRPTAPGRPPLAVVHFLVDFVPSTYFCVSVAAPLPAGETPAPSPGEPTNLYAWSLMPVSQKHYFIASLYSDGDIHSYGKHAPYLPEDRPMARYEKGHVISVQVGLRDMRTASSLSLGWDKVVDVSAVSPNPASGEPKRHEVHPYVIFFKNFQMVHRPLVFPHLAASEWPLRVGTFFTQVDQAVRIVAPPEGQRFRPLLPDATLPAPAAPPAL